MNKSNPKSNILSGEPLIDDRVVEDPFTPEFYAPSGSMISFDGTNFIVSLLGIRLVSAPLEEALDESKGSAHYQKYVVGKFIIPPTELKRLGAALSAVQKHKSQPTTTSPRNFQ